ncbi:hypothetical protein [Streptomyces sp. NBC_00038]|uniref:hypothetical protein n=1 Tax=Streptomyces sp. NBC_00038 TaxID=2903615 RepID=UPI00225AD887|nr:hypothetical protein [Streptomyces sp. NBC_00038]MCX5559476.1 hypothetical protein [Streptomyces sp. NBC_00038]
MPAVSTPDSAPEEAAQRPAAERSEGAESPLVPSAEGRGGRECAALDEPVDGLDLDDDVFPPLDDDVLDSGSLADLMDAASVWSGLSDSLQPLVGLSTVLSEFTERANVGLAPAIAGLNLLIPRLPDIGEMVGQSLLHGLGTHRATLSAFAGVKPQVSSLSQTWGSVLQTSVLNTPGLLDRLSPARALLSVVEPQIVSCAGVLGSAAYLSSIAVTFQPLVSVGEFVRQSHVGLVPVLEGLPHLIPSLPSLAKMAGTLAPLADLIGGHVADLFAGVRSVADWAKRLKPSVLAEARYAFDAYMEGDKEPMKEFLRRCLRLWPVLEDHCQALAVAMFERAWEQEADLADDQSVRRVLIRYARQGRDSERDHQIRGASIGYIPDGWEQRDTVPGPEDLVISRLVPWAQQFETAPVRYVAGQLNEQEQALVRAWSENHPMPWPKASDLVQQDKAQGERARRKLIRSGNEWRRRENNRRELP